MKKIIYVLVIIVFSCVLNGCGLFVPPPWVDSKTVIIKDVNGDVIQSEYMRTVKGFANNDYESSSSWVQADRLVRSSGTSGVSQSRENPVPQRNKKYGVVMNNATKDIVWQNPEGPEQYIIKPGGYKALEIRTMPKLIFIQHPSGKTIKLRLKCRPKFWGGYNTLFVWHQTKAY